MGGVDGLIHITDLSWSRINHPNEILELDQKLNVVILDFDDDKSRIQLGLKQLSSHPWETLNEDLKEGDKVKGKVVVIADYGAFIEIEEGVEGLIHVSEMSWSTHLRSAQDFVNVGDNIEAIVLNLDRESRKMSLGMKQLSEDPWTDITNKFPIGSKHKGSVRNFTNFGVFIELQGGIDGLVHLSDISWDESEESVRSLNKGDVVDALVLSIEADRERISLGMKQLLSDSLGDYVEANKKGSRVKATIIGSSDERIELELSEEVKGYLPMKDYTNSMSDFGLEEGTEIEVVIANINRKEREIILSLRALERQEEKSALQDNALKNKEIEEATKSNIGDLKKAEMTESGKEDE